VRTVKVLGGSGIEMRGPGYDICLLAGLGCLDWNWDAVGRVGQECPTHTVRDRGQFQRRTEIGGQAAGLFGGGLHPLIQSGADAAALVLVFDYYEAQEAASRRQTRAHGVDAGEHAVEGEGHVVVFGELEDSEHAAGAVGSVISVSNSRSG
jgi:hypothetical protein